MATIVSFEAIDLKLLFLFVLVLELGWPEREEQEEQLLGLAVGGDASVVPERSEM